MTSTWKSSNISNRHATEIVSDDAQAVYFSRTNVFPTGLPDPVTGTELEEYNVRISCRYRYNGGDNASGEAYDYDLYQFFPLKRMEEWEISYPNSAPRENGLFFTVTPLSDLHYKLYLKGIEEGDAWDRALSTANFGLSALFDDEKYLPVAPEDDFLFSNAEQAAYEESLLSLARQITDTNIAVLNDLIAENVFNCRESIICVSIIGSGSPLLQNGRFTQDLDGWTVTQVASENASGSITTSFIEGGEKAVTLDLVSNRPSTDATKPVFSISQDQEIDFDDNGDLFVVADIETIFGSEGSIALFTGTGVAAISVSYFNEQTWLGESIAANFADAGGLENIPFIRANPTTIRSDSNTHIFKIPNLANSSFVIDLESEIRDFLPDVDINQVDSVRISAFVTDFHTVNDPIAGTQCLDCRATVKLRSLNLVRYVPPS